MKYTLGLIDTILQTIFLHKTVTKESKQIRVEMTYH